MTLLWLVVSNNAVSMVKNGITNQMTDAVESRAAIIDEYVLSADVYAAVTTVRVLVGVLCAAMAAGGVILADKAVRQGGREDEREETSGHIRRRFAPLRGNREHFAEHPPAFCPLAFCRRPRYDKKKPGSKADRGMDYAAV